MIRRRTTTDSRLLPETPGRQSSPQQPGALTRATPVAVRLTTSSVARGNVRRFIEVTVAHLHHRRRAATQGVPPGAGCQRSARLPDGGCWPASTRTGSRRSSSRIPASRPVLGPFATGDLPRYHSGPWADNQHASIAGRGNGQDHSARRADRVKDCLSPCQTPSLVWLSPRIRNRNECPVETGLVFIRPFLAGIAYPFPILSPSA